MMMMMMVIQSSFRSNRPTVQFPNHHAFCHLTTINILGTGSINIRQGWCCAFDSSPSLHSLCPTAYWLPAWSSHHIGGVQKFAKWPTCNGKVPVGMERLSFDRLKWATKQDAFRCFQKMISWLMGLLLIFVVDVWISWIKDCAWAYIGAKL